MPLHTGDPVGIARPLDALDGPVGGARSNAQMLARLPNRLVMRAVDDRLRPPGKRGETASGHQSGRMGRIVLGFRHEILFAMRRCGRRLRPKILNERAAQIDVEELAAVADGQDRLFLGKGMLEDGTVSLFNVYL